MWWLVLIFPVLLLFIAIIYPTVFQNWYTQKTQGDRYFSLPLKQRQQFKRTLQKHARLLLPIYRFMAKGVKARRIPTITFRNIKAPSAIASTETFANAVAYPASDSDIFVATFMKSGTTWMQNIVFEILHHGEGDLSDEGYKHLYALSPWLECSPNASVSIENAPLISRYKKRLVKTHLPADLCPMNKQAKYIYVTRHPVSTFSSCEHFFQMLMGPFCPDTKALLKLFCSDNMLWGSWPAHVAGWWQQAQTADNILFIRYEDLQKNTYASLESIARFLGITLTTEELEKIASKTSIKYMKAHEYYFEMAPPNVFSESTSISFLENTNAHSRKNSGNDVIDTQVIMAFCNVGLNKNNISMATLYPQEDIQTG